MTILFFKDNEMLPYLGGISRINCNLKDALVRRGYEVFFMSSSQKENLQVLDCQRYLFDLKHLYSKQNIDYLKQFIKDNNVKVILNSSFQIDAMRLINDARRDTECKVVTWIHNNIVEYGSLLGYRKEKKLREKHLGLVYYLITSRPIIKILRHFTKLKHNTTAHYCYHNSDRIVTVCDGNVSEFLFLLGGTDKEHKVVSINNFVNPIDYECNSSEKHNNVVWCGTVDFELKKTNWMLEIWSYVQPYHKDWTLFILGDGSSLEALKIYAKQLGLEGVVFTGRVSPMPYYREASILCSTSISESFGLTLVEAMQHKAVPIAFDSSAAIRDVVGFNGIRVRPYDKGQFAAELAALMDNKPNREFRAEKCYIASLQYDESCIIHLWEKLFETLDKKV